MKALNARYLGKYTPTDVLAFDSSLKKGEILADIAISTDTAIRNARTYRTSASYEVYLYVIHGLLHLLGYDDKTTGQKKIMQKEAAKYVH